MKRIKNWIESAAMLAGVALVGTGGIIVIAFFWTLQFALPVAAIIAILYAVKYLFFN
jgi:hypothetical protein